MIFPVPMGILAYRKSGTVLRSSSGVYIKYSGEGFVQSRHVIMKTVDEFSETSRNSSCGVHLLLQFHLQSMSLINELVGVVLQSRKDCFSVKAPKDIAKGWNIGESL